MTKETTVAKALLAVTKMERNDGFFSELIITGNLIEQGMEDPTQVTIEVDSIGPKWITGHVREFGFISKFQVCDEIEARIERVE